MQVAFFSDGLLRAVALHLGIAGGASLGQKVRADEGEVDERVWGNWVSSSG